MTRGIAVVGMHRSGTSAITRVLNLLGLHTCIDADLLGADEFNTRGHWESSTVTSCSELLLWTAQAAWWVPPAERSWLAPWSQRVRPAAASAFKSVHPSQPWVVKDPRLCLTLPFWRATVDIAGLVLVCRHPSSVADSLGRRGGMDRDYGAALWERYTRSLLESAIDLPALVTFYDALVDDVEDWIASASDFLSGVGMPVHDDRMDEVTAFLSDDMRHFASEREMPMSTPQVGLWDLCKDLAGIHRRLPQCELGKETPETRQQFAAARRNIRPPEWGPQPSEAFVRFRESVETIVAVSR